MSDVTKLRYWPQCACTEEMDHAATEARVIACATGAAMSAYHNKVNQQLCATADDYISLTVITTMVCGMSITEDSIGEVDEAAFERVLATLVDDVRARRASIENFASKQQAVRH